MTASYSSSSTEIRRHHHRSSSPSSSIASTSTLSTSPDQISNPQSSIPPPTVYRSQMIMQQGIPTHARSSNRHRHANGSIESHDDSEDETYIDPIQAYARVIYEHTRQQMDNTITMASQYRRPRNNSNINGNNGDNSNRQSVDRLSQHHYQQRERRIGGRT